jgi:hypothetical protein
MLCRCLTFLIYLLLSLSAGFGTYALGAVTWSVIDPEGAGAKLLFTIPVALAGMAIPGIIGLLCWTFRCDFIPEPKPARATTKRPAPVAAPEPAPAPAPEPALLRPTRTPRPATNVDDDMELVLAT